MQSMRIILQALTILYYKLSFPANKRIQIMSCSDQDFCCDNCASTGRQANNVFYGISFLFYFLSLPQKSHSLTPIPPRTEQEEVDG
jgi:hypothetical protein